MKKVIISELPLYNSLKGLFTLGTDKDNRSVKVSLEFIETTTEAAVKKANDAAAAAKTTAENAAETAKQTAETAAAAAKKTAEDAAKVATTAATNADNKAKAAQEAAVQAQAATKSANGAASKAEKAAENADSAAQEATKATTEANSATEESKSATAAAIKAKEDAEESATGANEAKEAANAAAESLVEFLGKILPTGLTVESVPRLTVGNVSPVRINAILSPEGVRQNIIFLSDNKSVTVAPDGRLTIVGKGRSTVHVIPTVNTALAKTLEVVVGEPTLRLVTRTRLRLTSSGALRLN